MPDLLCDDTSPENPLGDVFCSIFQTLNRYGKRKSYSFWWFRKEYQYQFTHSSADNKFDITHIRNQKVEDLEIELALYDSSPSHWLAQGLNYLRRWVKRMFTDIEQKRALLLYARVEQQSKYLATLSKIDQVEQIENFGEWLTVRAIPSLDYSPFFKQLLMDIAQRIKAKVSSLVTEKEKNMPYFQPQQDDYLQPDIDRIALSLGVRRLAYIKQYIRKAQKLQQKSLRDGMPSLANCASAQARHFQYLSLWLNQETIELTDLQALYRLWETDCYYIVKAQTAALDQRNFIIMYITQKLEIDEALQKRGISISKALKMYQQENLPRGYFLNNILQVLQNPELNKPDLTDYVQKLYQDWENASQHKIMLLPLREQFNAILAYIRERRQFESQCITAKLSANRHFSDLMMKHHEYLMLCLADKARSNEHAKLFPLYQWYLFEYEEAAKHAAPADLEKYQVYKKLLEQQIESRKLFWNRPSLPITLSSPTGVKLHFTPIAGLSQADQFLVEMSNRAFQVVNPFLERLKKLSYSWSTQEVISNEATGINEVLRKWHKVYLVVHPDKVKGNKEVAGLFWKLVVNPISELLDAFKVPLEKELVESFIDSLETTLKEVLTNVTKGKASSLPWEVESQSLEQLKIEVDAAERVLRKLEERADKVIVKLQAPALEKNSRYPGLDANGPKPQVYAAKVPGTVLFPPVKIFAASSDNGISHAFQPFKIQ